MKTINKFIGLSRMSHSVLDLAHPAAGALLAFGGIPDARTIILGFVAAFAGYTAVFALNDVLDSRVDKEKMKTYTKGKSTFDLDSLGARHPIAQGVLQYKTALAWVFVWGVISLVSAFLLKPICGFLLLAAVGLEIGYCKLLRVSHWKAVLSGLMVAVGGLAGLFAVSDSPSFILVFLFIFWAACWEVGGRNIANDWSDIEEDEALGIKTLPIKLGRKTSATLAFGLAVATVVFSLLFVFASDIARYIYLPLALVAGYYFLLQPGLNWVQKPSTESALKYFNRACFYPLSVFVAIAISIILGAI